MNKAAWAGSGPVIALDTSTAAMAAAIIRDGEVLGEVQSLAERNHSVHVISHLKDLLSSSNIKPEELAGIVVGNGPGSYTGMRIAVTAAKTLAWCWEKPLAGVSSLEAIAFGAWHRGMEDAPASGEFTDARTETSREHWVLPIMDARRGQVYAAGFVCRAGADTDGANVEEWSRFAEDGVRLMERWVDSILERIKDMVGRKAGSDGACAEEYANSDRIHAAVPVVWLVGDLSLHGPAAERLAAQGAELGAEVRLTPYVMEGRYLAELGQRRLAAGENEDPHTFIPNYTQLTEAEVKLKAKRASEG
ncbi:tRNA (adenosine(37)-N6)-threonylcarbamoyltransferase complex dimerization subunit type 1 TsaB [Paenibacillus sp. MY03]|jgi:tRNA threonylcarbamoyladenosine biosynthesis protein TsaB|uniref:tRNA (adenosine(37)-N6)-threonylcarbamoyltransferase complex dimerization subunit type 1 TsaB n=1 Tax=Paenibacillus sp. MY03 TaxID=302980 RepID=UPI000B3BE4EF|nr:tRNA (adenosine(37)-N6)-threonylcarbamoyltransferase complex dimerization subunit type 1 TsaB [Paenibacillus sp. MY03]OUS71150.1 tRNA (adenosine(37)-N6)-threonylcarbamoyltransferase complex dimerization subunit type 1 TsaB [Paenibacillus sp. MY03]